MANEAKRQVAMGIFGDSAQIPTLKTSLKDEILSKDLDFSSGLEYRRLNPDPLLRAKGYNLHQLYDLMLLDDKIKGMTELRKKMTLATHYDFMPASDSPEDEEINDFITGMFENLETPLYSCMENALDAKSYGFQCAEKIFDTDENGLIILKNLKFKHSIFFDFEYDEWAKFKIFWVGFYYGKYLPYDADEAFKKFIIFSYPYAKNVNYYGESELSSVYEAWNSKTRIIRYRNQRLQNFGQPILNVKYDIDTVSSTEKEAFQDMLDNIQDNLYILNPAKRIETGELVGKFSIEMLESSKSSATTEYNDAIDQLDTQIARRLLVPDHVGFTPTRSGSFALGATQLDTFKFTIEYDHRALEDLVNRQIIKQIVDLNFEGVKEYPKLKFDKLSANLDYQMLQTLITNKIVDPKENWIRKYVNIPDISEKEKEEIAANPTVVTPQPVAGQPSITKPEDKQAVSDGYAQKFKAKEPYWDAEGAKKTLDKCEIDFIKGFKEYLKGQIDYVSRWVQKRKIIENNDMKTLKDLELKKGELKKLMSEYYAKLFTEGKINGIEEIRKRIKVSEKLKSGEWIEKFQEDDWLDREWIDNYLKEYGDLGILTDADMEYLKNLRHKAFFVTGEVEDAILKEVRHIIENGISSSTAYSQIISQLENVGDAYIDKYALTIARTNASTAYNTGRMNLFMSDGVRQNIEAYVFTAIIDNVTTDICKGLNGRYIMADDPQLMQYMPPMHFNCRSTLTPVVKGENDIEGNYFQNYQDNFDKWNYNIKPADGFNGQ